MLWIPTNVETLRERLRIATEAIRARDRRSPRVTVVLGSGLGSLADELDRPTRIPYGEIPGFAASTVPGHEGSLVIGEHGGVVVAALKGRVHLYEGNSADVVTLPVRTLCHLGVQAAILTNAAGSLRPSIGPGSLCVLGDHINLTGQNPLTGPNDEAIGPRFPDMTRAYDPALATAAFEEATRLGIEVHRGVYAGLAGPSYETPAEIRMLATLGADVVGMSTVAEAIALRHMGARVLGISCVTNLAAGIGREELTHEDVQRVAARARQSFGSLVLAMVLCIGRGA
ncbi:MAG: purine-nucleoside phosphorylase [Deltaproteobacteria bacterium]|nr:purine-nucleoside phosphorylase [Deltaproteobacteria bacterium]